MTPYSIDDPMTALDPREVPFDTIADDSGGRERRLSSTEFLELPLHERVRLILGRNLRFLRDGEIVERGTALRYLMDVAKRAAT